MLGAWFPSMMYLRSIHQAKSDALILPLAQVNANKLASGGDDEAEEAGGAAGEMAKARGKLVSSMMKKHLMETVVPVIIEIRRLLTETRHPLLGSLMACLAALLKVRRALTVVVLFQPAAIMSDEMQPCGSLSATL